MTWYLLAYQGSTTYKQKLIDTTLPAFPTLKPNTVNPHLFHNDLFLVYSRHNISGKVFLTCYNICEWNQRSIQ